MVPAGETWMVDQVDNNHFSPSRFEFLSKMRKLDDSEGEVLEVEGDAQIFT